MSNTFNSNVEALLGKLENFASTKTVVGEPVYLNDIILLPLIEISFAVGAGVMDDEKDVGKDKRERVGGGMGGKITPSAVIVINEGNVQLVNVKNQDSLNKLIDLFPGVLSKFNFNKKPSAMPPESTL